MHDVRVFVLMTLELMSATQTLGFAFDVLCDGVFFFAGEIFISKVIEVMVIIFGHDVFSFCVARCYRCGSALCFVDAFSVGALAMVC